MNKKIHYFFILSLTILISIYSCKKENSSSLNVGLVAYYPFNGDVLDHSGNGNNGRSYGTLTPTTDHKGNSMAAYYFNGTDSYVEVPDAPSLNPTSQLTVSAWYSPVVSARATPYITS